MGKAASSVALRDPVTDVAIGRLIVQAMDSTGRVFAYEIVDPSGHFITGGVQEVPVDVPVTLNADKVAHGLSQQVQKDFAVVAATGQVSTSTAEAYVAEVYSERDAEIEALEKSYKYKAMIETFDSIIAAFAEPAELDLGLDLATPLLG